MMSGDLGPYIDPHVHCRDFSQQYKATIKSTMQVAAKNGVVAICDMPNTDPPMISRDMIEKRLTLAQSEGVGDGYYVYIGVTSNPAQVREAVEVVNENPKVIGMKLYAGTSVGNLAVIRKDEQKAIYEGLAGCGYTGLIAVHCEKEDMFKMDLWDPKFPSTWNAARPPEAELESVKDQVELATAAGFKGTLHIPHISTPEAVDFVYGKKDSIRITCGVTPHHLTYSTSDMGGADGIMYKVNPPIRSPDRVAALRKRLWEGRIDWIETDHAPHTNDEKREKYMSGIRSLDNYADFIQGLASDGLPEDLIRKVTYGNIKRHYPKIIE